MKKFKVIFEHAAANGGPACRTTHYAEAATAEEAIEIAGRGFRNAKRNPIPRKVVELRRFPRKDMNTTGTL